MRSRTDEPRRHTCYGHRRGESREQRVQGWFGEPQRHTFFWAPPRREPRAASPRLVWRVPRREPRAKRYGERASLTLSRPKTHGLWMGAACLSRACAYAVVRADSCVCVCVCVHQTARRPDDLAPAPGPVPEGGGGHLDIKPPLIVMGCVQILCTHCAVNLASSLSTKLCTHTLLLILPRRYPPKSVHALCC